ncbi:hypothetical protein A0H81_10358 [Grifola frondosa]|uniref:Uncharacterized protein n=1 Tax=Grifola frondosa TaxID=5627 RepID=A0A1C7M473_GRIFR|nr:hypothetical protein A0H81_10358 [Grifola frondosa]
MINSSATYAVITACTQQLGYRHFDRDSPFDEIEQQTSDRRSAAPRHHGVLPGASEPGRPPRASSSHCPVYPHEGGTDPNASLHFTVELVEKMEDGSETYMGVYHVNHVLGSTIRTYYDHKVVMREISRVAMAASETVTPIVKAKDLSSQMLNMKRAFRKH